VYARRRNLLTTHIVGPSISQLPTVDLTYRSSYRSRPVTEPVRDTGRQVAIHAHIHDAPITLRHNWPYTKSVGRHELLQINCHHMQLSQ